MRLASPIVRLAHLAVSLALFATAGICGATEDADSAPAFEAQIGRHGRPIVLDVALADQGTAQFMLDTGAATTVFDASLRDIAGQPIGTRRIQTAKGEVQLDTYPCPQAKVGSLDLEGVEEVVFVDLTPMRAATGYEIKGVLGIDFLGRFAIEVDFDGGALRMWKAAPVEWNRERPTPLLNLRGTPHVECLLPGGRREPFVVDTGANVSTVTHGVFDALAGEQSLTVFAAGSAATAAGYARNLNGSASSLELSPFIHRDIRIDRGDLSLLGLHYLSRYRLRLDLPGQRAYFHPGERFNVPDSSATSGMAVIHSNGQKIIVSVEADGAAHHAGILPGDVIEEVNGRLAAEEDMHQLRQLFTSVAGDELKLKVLRKDRHISTKLILQARTPTGAISR